MSDTPSTIEASETSSRSYPWDDTADLHRCEDGGGLFHNFKTIRSGTVAELIRFVMGMPEERQDDYAIEKAGDHTLRIGEIRNLFRRADFPAA
ncbi:hypothetical protein [Novosphingobium soli]|uniref:Uncharacterized protein n=1 Tax=Novosphingobium soli TaxID=574956 RepID=A0ABV6CYM3_9SPHN